MQGQHRGLFGRVLLAQALRAPNKRHLALSIQVSPAGVATAGYIAIGNSGQVARWGDASPM